MRSVYRYVLEPSAIADGGAPDGAAAWDDEPDEGINEFHSTSEGYIAKVLMPEGAEILNVKLSSKGLLLYALVDTGFEPVLHEFFVVGNGREVPDSLNSSSYIGTAKRQSGRTAHVFELVPVAA